MFKETKDYFAGWGLKAAINFFQDWHIGERLWLIIATIAILFIVWYMDNLWYVALASLTGIWNDILIAKGKIINFVFGIINNVLYALISFQNDVYGQGFLFLCYFLPMQFYGWYVWIKPENHTQQEVVAKKLSMVQWLIGSIITLIATLGIGLLLKLIGETTDWTDAFTDVLSVVAMLLMARLYVEQWICWIVINVVTIAIWLQQSNGGDTAILAMWIVFLINSVYGYLHWLKLSKARKH